jgi:alpha-tubulin suppressor-like RCC1 family protein
LAAGTSHTCGATASGTTLCWGADGAGQLGDGRAADGSRTAPDLRAPVVNSAALVQLAAGNNFACGVRGNGDVVCWGGNNKAQLGRNGGTDGDPHPTAAAIAGPRDAVEVTAGTGHTCLRRDWGGVMCWGDNAVGQVGDGTTTTRGRAVFVVGLP